jgi:PAS domain S-box-containing protein
MFKYGNAECPQMDLITSYQELKQKIESALAGSSVQDELAFELEDFEKLLIESLKDISGECEQYKMLYENAADSICIHTASGKILASNASVSNRYQYSSQELLEMNIALLEASGQVNSEKISEVMQTGQVNYETTHICRDGSCLIVDVTCRKISWNGQTAIISICHDITERKNAEKALRESELKFREIIRQTNDGIVVFDENKEIVIWNRGAESIFGISAREVLNTSIVDQHFKFAPSWYRDRELINKTIDSIISFEDPGIFYRIRDDEAVDPESGETKILETVLFPIKIDDHYLFGGIIRDITEKKKYEEELLQLNASKDRFMQVLAHDLRSPFNALLGFSELLLSNLYECDMHVIEYQLTLQRNIIQKTFFLLEDMLLWSKSQLGMLDIHLQEIALDELFREIIDSLKASAETKRLSVSYFGEENTIVTSDTYMLKTVIRNLLSNAIKFTDKGGMVKMHAFKEGGFLIVTVIDNGIGISGENQKKLWHLDTPFTIKGTNGEQGTGLGLLICKDFIEKLGGKIWLTSQLGKGSEFRFSLPLNPSFKKDQGHGSLRGL